MISTNLLGCGVGGRHEADICAGERGGHGRGRVFKMFCDTEIEESNGAVILDENVGGFEVAMNHRVRVCVLHRLAYCAKQFQAVIERAIVLFAVVDERGTLDIFHHQQRRAISESVGVVETRDGRMVELREGLLLG